ncbi:MAG: hypothetical protein JWQ25_1992 [Daejeonella sp.]|nr:hypothetical protein [Daejeonella sp.]
MVGLSHMSLPTLATSGLQLPKGDNLEASLSSTSTKV